MYLLDISRSLDIRWHHVYVDFSVPGTMTLKLERYRTEKISIGWLQVKVKSGTIGTIQLIQRGFAKGGLKQKSFELLMPNEMFNHGGCVCVYTTVVLPLRIAWSDLNNHEGSTHVPHYRVAPLLHLGSHSSTCSSAATCQRQYIS